MERPVSSVSVLVSLYNAERYLRGCLDHLLAQTLYTAGDLELIVVNAGSTDGTRFLLWDYLGRGIPLQIITSMREPLYASWNRAVRLATGEFCAICNADDRLAPHALETLRTALVAHPECGLAYADAFVTSAENAAWGGDYTLDTTPPYTDGKLSWPEFDPLRLLHQCYIGQSPMWRRALHQQYGLFDASYLLAGDFEWALRLAANGVRFHHVAEPLGIFRSGGMGMGNQEQSGIESRRAVLEWQGRIRERWTTRS